MCTPPVSGGIAMLIAVQEQRSTSGHVRILRPSAVRPRLTLNLSAYRPTASFCWFQSRVVCTTYGLLTVSYWACVYSSGSGLKTSFVKNLNKIGPVDFVLALGPHNNKVTDRHLVETNFLVLGTSKRIFLLKTQHRFFNYHNTIPYFLYTQCRRESGRLCIKQ